MRDGMRYVTRDGNDVTRDGAAGVVDPDAGLGVVPSREDLSTALSGEERERVRKASNAERQRRFRRRRAARRAEAAGHGTQDRNDTGQAAGRADGQGGARDLEASVPGPVLQAGYGRGPGEELLRTAPGSSERDRRAEFGAWFRSYPRQEGEIPALWAWMAEPELPPLAHMLGRLAAQKAAKPDARYWPAPDRYLREKRWRDQPPPSPGRVVQARSVWAQLRAMGSDEGRRQRLREISAAARFDPFAPGGSRG